VKTVTHCVAAGACKHFDFENDDGMRSLFETTLQYLHGITDDFYGVDVGDVRETLRTALDDSSVINDWKIKFEHEYPVAAEQDCEYTERLG
jgi:predicted metal-dependent hydrolase